MKKVLLSIALAGLLGSTAFSQDGDSRRPVSGDIGMVAGFNLLGTNNGPSNTGTIGARYYLADDMAARVGLNVGTNGSGVTNPDFTTGAGTWTGDTAGGVQTTAKWKHMSWTLNLGVQKSFDGTGNLEPYAGADIFFGGTSGKGDMTTDYLRDDTSAFGSGTLAGDFDKTEYENFNGGFTFGVNIVAGFNWYLAKKLAIGAEFSYGFSNSSTKVGNRTDTIKRGSTETSVESTSEATTKMGGLGTSGSGTISLTWFL